MGLTPSCINSNHTVTYDSNIPNSGPFTLTDVFSNGLWASAGVPFPSLDYVCPNSALSYNSAYWTFTGGNIPIHTIYYGSTSSTQQNVLKSLFTGIGSSSLWTVAKTYKSNVATPVIGSILSISCGGFYASDGQCAAVSGCNIQQFNEQGILNYAQTKKGFPSAKQGIYVIVGGVDVTYTVSSTGKLMSNAANSDMCATHDVSTCGKSAGLVYIYTQMLNTPNSPCNIAKYLQRGFPNGDYAVDNVAAILVHEIVEGILSPQMLSNGSPVSDGGSAWKDGCSKEPADKCTNQFLNVGGSGVSVNNANANIGGKNFLLFPIWDNSKGFCSMGIGSSPIPASSCPSPASVSGGACGAGVGSCPTSANPYCSQYGFCGSTSAYQTNGQTTYNYCSSLLTTKPSCPSPANVNGGGCGSGVGSCPTSSNPYCSQYGFCGSTSDYQTNGQPAYNFCG